MTNVLPQVFSLGRRAYSRRSKKMKPDIDAIKGALKSKYLDPRDNYLSDIRALLAHITSLEAKLAVAVQTLQSSKEWLYYGCLELTAYSGIPEKKRESMIKEVVSNFNFIIDEQLEKIGKL